MTLSTAVSLRIYSIGQGRFPFALRITSDPPLLFLARSDWPREHPILCVPAQWLAKSAALLREERVIACERFGGLISVVIDTAADRRMTFRFTDQGIWWNTTRTTAFASAGYRTPMVGALASRPLLVLVDDREKFPYRFRGYPIQIVRQRLIAGDYVVGLDWGVAAVERKGAADFVQSISEGRLAAAMAELATLRRAAVVVEDRLTSLPANRWCSGEHLVEVVVTLSVRYPHVQIVFAGSRAGAELWTARWLAAAVAELAPAANQRGIAPSQ
jgi:hypothetical protein